MSYEISASFDELHRQAKDSAESYLTRAIRNIDEAFGDGYAKQNPQLVAAFMQSATTEFTMAALSKVLGYGLDNIADALRNPAD